MDRGDPDRLRGAGPSASRPRGSVRARRGNRASPAAASRAPTAGRAARVAISFGLGLAVPAALYVAYNEVRWGTIIDQGYVLIPGVLEDPIYAKHGIFSIWYIPRNVFAILFRSWNYVDDAPWLQPSWWGLGIFLTTPLYLWLAKARLRRSPMVAWAAVSAVLVSLPSSPTATSGSRSSAIGSASTSRCCCS